MTIAFRMLIGDIECSTTGGFRTFSNRVQLYGDDQNPNMGAPYGAGVYDDDDATATFDVAAPPCDQYDVATQITEPVLQSTNGVTGGGPFEYTVTVVNNGPDGVTDVPFVFGLYHATYWQVPDPYINLWTIDSNIVCTPSGGAVCPTGYTINAQETFTNATTGVVTSGSLQPPDLEATIPNLPSGGSLAFTIVGTAGEFTDCTPVTLYHNAYAHALPISALSETNINLPNTSSFASYYLRTSSGFPAAALTNGSYYGNNGYNLQTQWVTGNGSTCPGDDPALDYDLSTQMTGPFANPGDVTPIAGPLAPGQLVYYRVIANNLDDGDDTLNFGNPTTDSTVPYAQAYLQVRNFLGFASSFPSWLDRTTGESGFGFTDPELAHALDTTPNNSSLVPWAAWQAIGATCVNTSGGAQCPEANDEVYWGSINNYGDLAIVSVPASGNLGGSPSDAGHELEGLSLPVGSNIEFVLPYRVPPATVNCVPGGAVFTPSGSNSGPQAEIQSWPNTVSVNYFQTTTDYNPNYPRYLERNNTNDKSTLTMQIEIPACVGALEIDKQIVAPAAADLIPESGLVQYTVDLTYPAAATQALDVAQFTDVPSLTCANYPFNSSSQAAYNACAEYRLVNVVSCSVVSGNATCPPSIPIGQQLAQDGTLTAIDAGTIDTRWGTPSATTVAGGAAFEPGSTIRITLEAQLSNEVSPVNTLVNRATYASDADSSQFGKGLFAEDSETISPPQPDSMVLRKQVSQTDAQQGEAIVYTLEAINNGLADGQGAYIVDTVPADLLAANPAGFTNLTCAAITTSPPLMEGANTADCANVSMNNNGAAGFRIDMTGSWPLNSGYRFTFEAIAPFSGTSIDNTAVLTPPPASNSQRFGPTQDSTANFRTPDEYGAIQVTKQVVTTDGSNPSVSDNFTITVNCGGATVTPGTSQTVTAGNQVTFSDILANTSCTVSEDTLTLPAAPTGYTWVNSQLSASQVTITGNQTATLTATNTLAPLPEPPTAVLTVTKTISGTGSGPFDITVNGPSGYISTTTINGGETKLFTGLASGVYTVTESTPAGWTTVYTATPGTGGSTNAVVTLQNSNSATLASTPISGMVFRDFNSDGLITANGAITDTGVPNVTVTAYDKNGNNVGSATTDSNGEYTINPSGDGPYRVEFSHVPDNYEPSTHGTQNGTNVQFVTSAPATDVNFGLTYPNDYCQSNPYLAVSCMKNGSGIGNSDAGYLTFALNASGSSTAPNTVAQVQEVGSVWGNAYQRATKTLFTAAFVKRHAGFGPTGIGGVYLLEMNTGTGAGTLLGSFDLQGVTPANSATPIDLGAVTRANVTSISAGAAGDNELPSASTSPSRDLAAFAKVGAAGYGDIDLSDDGNTLWLVNLNQNTLLAVNVADLAQLPTDGSDVASGLVSSYAIAGAGVPDCGTDNLRPWGVKMYQGRGYLGVVCDAATTQSTANLNGYVLSFAVDDPTSFTQELTIPFTYSRESLSISGPEWTSGAWSNYFVGNSAWQPWATTWAQRNPQPIIADIEFDMAGNMTLGIMDRLANQGGHDNYEAVSGSTITTSVTSAGDILRVCKDGNGWTVECDANDTNTALTPITDDGALSNDGPGGAGEFYANDYFYNHTSQWLEVFHWEIATGALAYNPLANEMATTVFDPLTVTPRGTGTDALFRTQGVHWYNAASGAKNRAYELVASSPGANPTTFGKASGIGDLELLCDPAPIEIGNRVWDDLDGNGVQDPGEPGLDNVTVSAAGSDGSNRTATTDVAGNYYFTATANTVYTLTMSVPTGYSLTTANADTLSGASVSSNHAISDTRDSDAVLVGGVATIYYTTGGPGQNNHGLDFGFTQPASGQVDILNTAPPILPAQFGDRVWIESDSDGNVNTGTLTPVAGMVITATNGSETYTTTTDAAGYYSFTVSAGTYVVTYGAMPASYGAVVPSTTPGGASASGNAGAYQEPNNPDQSHSQNTTVTVAAGEANWQVDFAFTPAPAILQLNKTVTGGTSNAVFTVTVSGPDGYNQVVTVTPGTPTTLNNLKPGPYTVQETGLPTAPSGLTWNGTLYTPADGSITLVAGETGAVTIANALAPVPPNPVTLVINKVVTGGAAAGPFLMTVSGPDSFSRVVSVTPGTPATLNDLAAGSYTVVETGMPDAPTGFAWQSAFYLPATGQVTLATGESGAITVTNPLTELPVQFGDRVWIEADGDGLINSGEVITPVVGMVITATNGITTYTTTTDNQGYFSFTVPSGTYAVTYGAVPPSYGVVVPSVIVGAANLTGAAGAYQDDQDVTHPQGTTVALAAGEENWLVDFAFTPNQTFDLALIKTLAAGQPALIQPGDPVTFTLTVTNQGNVDAYDIDLVDYIPTGMTLLDPDWSDNGATAAYTIDRLNAGQVTTVDVTLQVSAAFTGTSLINYAEISDASNTDNGVTATDVDSTPDTQSGNTPGEDANLIDDASGEDGKTGSDEDDHDPATVSVGSGRADLRLAKSVTPTTARRGDTVVYQLVLTNDGPGAATNVTVSDPLPSGVTYVSHDPAGEAVYSAATRTVTWTVDSLAAGASTPLTITVTVE